MAEDVESITTVDAKVYRILTADITDELDQQIASVQVQIDNLTSTISQLTDSKTALQIKHDALVAAKG